MSSSPSRFRSRELAVGAALLGCSLASSAASGQTPMANVIVNSFTGTITAGSTSFTYTLSGGPTNLIFATGLPVIGTGTGEVFAARFLGMFDLLSIRLFTGSNNYTNVSGSGSWALTFTSDVLFVNNSSGTSVSWLANGQTVNNGDFFAAGAYNFSFNYNYSGPVTDSFAAGALFFQAPASGVPLPGAAGLAACGLLGLGRRRRR